LVGIGFNSTKWTRQGGTWANPGLLGATSRNRLAEFLRDDAKPELSSQRWGHERVPGLWL